MIVENNTNYSFWLKKKGQNILFKDLIDRARLFTDDFDAETNNELNQMLDRGVEIIKTEFQMQKYMERFGLMHYNKLLHAFDNLSDAFYNIPQIEIIDYGCGQGIGSFIYCEFLRLKGLSQKVKKITLIEPSEIALKRASLHNQTIYGDVEIVTINKFIGELDDFDIPAIRYPSLHIFSNILDIPSVDLFQLSGYVKSKCQDVSHYICLSPRNENFTPRINQFASFLEGICYCKEDYWKNEWNGGCAISLRIVEKGTSEKSVNAGIDKKYIDYIVGEELISNMIYVPMGTFRMGATMEQEEDAWDNEFPVHEVSMDGFHITKHPISQKLWYAVMGNNPSSFKNPDAPVDSVSWFDCLEFIQKLNSMFEFNLRLPTEAQWEYAARGGNLSSNYKYAGSDNIENVAHYSENAGYGTKPVCLKEPNELGIYDMSGNIWEWCQDWFSEYSNNRQINPVFEIQTNLKIIRGGGWNSGKDYCRISARQAISPMMSHNFIGLRLVMN